MNKIDDILSKIHKGQGLKDELTALKILYSYAHDGKLVYLNPEIDKHTLMLSGTKLVQHNMEATNNRLGSLLMQAIQEVEIELITLFTEEDEQNK